MNRKNTEPSPYNTRIPPYRRPGLTFDPDENMTKQAMKDECDINNIMAKYQRTGMLSHISQYAGQYGEYFEIDFQQAQETLIAGRQMFADLPSTVRKQFDNDPAEFMAFCADPQNKDDMAKMGLLDPAYKTSQEEEVPRGTTNNENPEKEEKTE